MRFVSPTGSPIIGTLETIIGRANAVEYSETGAPDYDGGTEVYWDEQKTVERNGSPVYLDENGGEWAFSQLVPDNGDDA